jgi:hypothetical protein
MFWFFVKDHAAAVKDTALGKRATDVIEQRFFKVKQRLEAMQRAGAARN